MPVEITMPALSPTMAEGNLAKWLVKEGDRINPGDVIAEIETDKATMEVEAVDEGTLAKILVPAGTLGIKVNTVIALLTEEGEDIKKITDIKSATSSIFVSDQAETKGIVLPEMPVAAPVFTPPPRSTKDTRVFASPLARRLAIQKGVDVGSLYGTGPHGRVIKRDVETDIKTADATLKRSGDDQLLQFFTQGEYEIIPHNSMRKTIAKRLVESKQTVPHFYVMVDCELDALLKLRSRLNKATHSALMGVSQTDENSIIVPKLSVNDMIIKAVALALKMVPGANVSWLEDGLARHAHSDIGVAVSINNGLITPIIRHADEKSLKTISSEMKELASRARQMKLRPEEYQGGTVSISNMGMFGVKAFSAIINPPQAIIFAIGAGEERVVAKNGVPNIATMMTVMISVDHRAVDGALAAELARTFKGLIENPLAILA
ncbi:MAG: pyruvate dehydrogenase E2 component (dihydrolipoamide acetyltransferase) [Candidatus Tokpelaia sp. JSC085]|nr:MAG: pyruvate dehydrogenase E2 component (dihydrolipoamide acetyltransferase) [Candidatus Tokpelaia sp. JSC085]